MIPLPFLIILVGFDGGVQFIAMLLKVELCDIVPGKWLESSSV